MSKHTIVCVYLLFLYGYSFWAKFFILWILYFQELFWNLIQLYNCILAILVTLFFVNNIILISASARIMWDCDLGVNHRIQKRGDKGKLLGNIIQISSSLLLTKFVPLFVKTGINISCKRGLYFPFCLVRDNQNHNCSFTLTVIYIIIHWTHYLFSDCPKAYSEFSKSSPVTS